MGGWRYIAERRDGVNPPEFIDLDLPLSDPNITETLSGPGALTGTIDPEVARMLVDGKPVLERWSTCIWAEADGQIRGGGFLDESGFDGPSWKLSCVGFSAYPQGQPYTDAHYWVKVDPMSMVSEIWKHVQGQQGGNIGVNLDINTSPIRIGTELKQGQYDAQTGPSTYEVGPYKLNWYETLDLGKELDNLAKSTPYDYVENAHWDGDSIALDLIVRYPTLGRRRDELRFVVGENVFTVPSIETNSDYANVIIVIGAGEGRLVKLGKAHRNDGRVRRVKVVTDKSLKTQAQVDQRAKEELAASAEFESISSIVVVDHDNARIGSWSIGDEILVQSDAGWRDVAIWCRIVASSISPESGNAATLTLLRSESA